MVVIPLYIATPSPPAPMKEAMPASATVMVTMLRIPDIITGMARGSFILISACIWVLPIPRAASKMSGFTFIIPVWVFLTMGRSAYTVKAMTAVAFPTPENGIRKPSMDMDGIVYKKFITPKAGLADFSNSLISIPIRPPANMAMKMAIRDISICSTRRSAKKRLFSISIFHVSCSIFIHPFFLASFYCSRRTVFTAKSAVQAMSLLYSVRAALFDTFLRAGTSASSTLYAVF